MLLIITILQHIENSGIFNTSDIFRTQSDIEEYEVYQEPWHGQNSLFRHFQAYSETLSNIEPMLKYIEGH